MRFWRKIALLTVVVGCVAGCGDAPEPVAMAAEARHVAPVVETPQPPRIDYPDLARGRYYKASANTAIQSALPGDDAATPRVEVLPANGIFQVIDRRPVKDLLWYRVLVSNGKDDYAMYLDAADLNGQDVRLVEPPKVAPAPPVVEYEPARPVSIPRVRLN